MTNTTITLIECGACGGHYVREGDNYAVCECGHDVTVSVDIAPNMDEGEVIAWHDVDGRQLLGYVSAEV